MVKPDGLPTRRLEWWDQRLHRRRGRLTASAAALSPFLTESARCCGRRGGKRQKCSARDPSAALIVNELKVPVGHCGFPLVRLRPNHISRLSDGATPNGLVLFSNRDQWKIAQIRNVAL